MLSSVPDSKLTVGQVLSRLRGQDSRHQAELYKALNTSSGTYLKILRDERDLSFLMALRLCKFYELDLHEFISMLGDEELARKDLSGIKAMMQRERKKAEALKAKVIDIKSEKQIPEVILRDR
jgi:transcriptional regulator with XRE-family HTH domain